MLSGKIIKISWFGDQGWKLSVDGMKKTFTDYHTMNSWLVGIIDKVKDLGKKQLLLDDLNKFLILGNIYSKKGF